MAPASKSTQNALRLTSCEACIIRTIYLANWIDSGEHRSKTREDAADQNEWRHNSTDKIMTVTLSIKSIFQRPSMKNV